MNEQPQGLESRVRIDLPDEMADLAIVAGSLYERMPTAELRKLEIRFQGTLVAKPKAEVVYSMCAIVGFAMMNEMLKFRKEHLVASSPCTEEPEE